MTTMKRALYTLGTAVLLLGATPALADDARPAHPCGADCRCARMTEPTPGSRVSAPAPSASSADRDDAFLREVWSAP